MTFTRTLHSYSEAITLICYVWLFSGAWDLHYSRGWIKWASVFLRQEVDWRQNPRVKRQLRDAGVDLGCIYSSALHGCWSSCHHRCIPGREKGKAYRQVPGRSITCYGKMTSFPCRRFSLTFYGSGLGHRSTLAARKCGGSAAFNWVYCYLEQIQWQATCPQLIVSS